MGVSAVRFAVGTAITRTDIPALCARLADLLRGQPGDLVECDVGGLAAPDVAAVEAVARLRLTARRHGRRLIVVGAGPDLLLLFGLLGLTELLTPETTGCAGPRREQTGNAEADGSRRAEAGNAETYRPQREATGNAEADGSRRAEAGDAGDAGNGRSRPRGAGTAGA